MHVARCVCAWNFGTKFFFTRGECETPKNSNLLKKLKNRNFGKNPVFSRSRMMKRISPLELSREN